MSARLRGGAAPSALALSDGSGSGCVVSAAFSSADPSTPTAASTVGSGTGCVVAAACSSAHTAGAPPPGASTLNCTLVYLVRSSSCARSAPPRRRPRRSSSCREGWPMASEASLVRVRVTVTVRVTVRVRVTVTVRAVKVRVRVRVRVS